MATAAQPRPLPEQLDTLAKSVDVAIKALFKSRNEEPKTEKPPLLEEDESVYLTVSLMKIPRKHCKSAYRIHLPHPLINTAEGSPELCLIIEDRSRSAPENTMKKIKSENVPITKVLNIKKLKSDDYRTFESQRKLCNSYERFFCDRRLIPRLPRLIGKKFFGKKQIPVGIDLNHRNWKEQIEKACRVAMFLIRIGTCSVIKVGNLSMGRDQIVENVMATLNGVVDILPDKWQNVRFFRLKLSESSALPIYQTVPDLKLDIDPIGVKDVKNGEGLVESGGDVDDSSKSVKTKTKKKKKKGRIHEVRHIDSNVSEIREDDENQMNLEDDEVDIGDLNGSRDKKKRKKMTSSESAVSEKLAKKSKQENVLKSKKLKNDIDVSGGGGLKAKTKRSK